MVHSCDEFTTHLCIRERQSSPYPLGPLPASCHRQSTQGRIPIALFTVSNSSSPPVWPSQHAQHTQSSPPYGPSHSFHLLILGQSVEYCPPWFFLSCLLHQCCLLHCSVITDFSSAHLSSSLRTKIFVESLLLFLPLLPCVPLHCFLALEL